MSHDALLHIELPLARVASGKVREVFAIDDQYLLFVASDRLSAFDVIMRNGIPDKGRILTQMAVFWFEQLAHLGAHHLVSDAVDDLPAAVADHRDILRGRSLIVKRCDIIPLEAIVRGYIAGSGWQEYQQHGSICGIPLPPGLSQCAALPKPLFTPSTKAAIGDHDENISPQRATEIVGADLSQAIAERALATYQAAHDLAASKGIILADTKFEFGLRDGQLLLADEVLTPDSSRFWDRATYQPGHNQASFDKQFVRDWLLSIDYDKHTPLTLPDSIVEETRARYCQAFQRLTGRQPAL
ncbi:MAG: phosphoribosylaminoimidazolesuccinocarboxamide synthase [Planctomycetota bacterium]|nr:MAG: phosphoribosylaminoimidazolesuccinocarboxamide synthase [Planctomycetota bacterium]